jgi:TM2 domain-containing membrane protein YozV
MTEEKTKFCPRCGTMIPYEEAICPLCGEPQPQFAGQKKKAGKRMWVAVVLSLLVTGLGQVYLGEWRRGLAFFGTAFVIGFVASDYVSYDKLIIMGVILAVIAAYDAYNISKRSR